MRLLSLLKSIKLKRKHAPEKAFERACENSERLLSGGFSDKSLDNLVLIGTVKNVEQFEICIKECFYHIPLRHLLDAGFDFKKDLYRIKYISLYQSLSQFGNEAGIEYIAEIESVSVVRRSDIKEIPKRGNDKYLYFKLSKWQRKTEKIKISEIGVYPFAVVPFGTFKASKEIAELMIHNSFDRELFRKLKQLSTDVNCTFFELGDYRFFDENDNLIVFRDEQCLLQLPMEVIRELPYSGFETVKEAMKL